MPHEIDCLICAGPCEALGVFHCGHFTCFTCALRLHHFGNKACPVCRKASDTLFVTRRTPAAEDGFDVELELLDFLIKANEKSGAKKGGNRGGAKSDSEPPPEPPSSIIRDNFLKCLIDDSTLAHHVAKLYEQLCPVLTCWHQGVQEPFLQSTMLRDHLHYDHKMRHCQMCLQTRPAFLCEQNVYTDKELDQHYAGTCKKDVASFQGHPLCRFCNGRRFYDVEHLVKHLQHDHFTCDLCNRGTFSFTFYQNRGKLIEHFQRSHRLCEHPDCADKDPMLRVFNTELDLQAHRQREHGAGSAGLSLEALGMFAAPSASPMTGANSAATRITFDFVSRVDVIDTSPKTGGDRGRGGASRNEQHHSTFVIPRHYVNPADHMEPLISKESMGTPLQSSTTSRDTPHTKNTSPQAATFDKRNGSKNAEAATQLAAANEKFEALIRKFLANPRLFVDFRHAAGDYLSGKLLASEFYQSLTDTFFPQAEQLNEIFPLLIETMPIAQKAEGLNQIRRMRNAPEIQRLQRAKEEDDRKAAAAALLNATSSGKQGKRLAVGDTSSSAVVNQILSKNQNRAGVWSGSTPPPRPAPTAAAHSVHDSTWTVANNANNSSSGSARPPSGSPTSRGGHTDPEDFPSLPGSGASRRPLPPRAAASRPAQNVWAQKAAKK